MHCPNNLPKLLLDYVLFVKTIIFALLWKNYDLKTGSQEKRLSAVMDATHKFILKNENCEILFI